MRDFKSRISNADRPSHENIPRRILKGASLSGLHVIVEGVTSFASIVVITRFLLPGEFGLLVLSLLIVSVAGIGANLGIDSALVKYLADYMARKDLDAVSDIIINSMKLRAILGLLVGYAVYLSADIIALDIFRYVQLADFIRIAAFSIILGNAFGSMGSIYQGLQQFKCRAFFLSISSALSFFLTAIPLLLGLGAIGVVKGRVIAHIMGGLIGTIYLFRIVPLTFSSRRISFSRCFFMLSSFGIYPTLEAIISMLYTQINVLILGLYWTTKEVGFFSVALQTASYIGVLSGLFGVALYPIMSELFAIGDRNRLKEVFTFATKYAIITSLPIACFMIALAYPLVTTVYTMEYELVAQVLPITALLMFVPASGYTMSNLCYSSGRPDILTKVGALMAILNVGFCYLLIPSLGAIGASVALLITYAGGYICDYLWIVKAIKVTLPFKVILLRPLYSALLAGISSFAIYTILPSLGGFILGVCIGLIAYTLSLILTGAFDLRDLGIIEKALGRKFSLLEQVIGKLKLV